MLLHYQDDDPTPERPENLQTRLVEDTKQPQKAEKQKAAGVAESLQEAADKPQAVAATAAAADSVVQPQVRLVPCAMQIGCKRSPALLSSCCCRAVHTLRATCVS